MSSAMSMFVGAWLNDSETFIYDQIQHQRIFESTVYCRNRQPGAVRFPYAKFVPLTLAQRIRYYSTGRARTFHASLHDQRPSLIHAHVGTNGVRATSYA